MNDGLTSEAFENMAMETIESSAPETNKPVVEAAPIVEPTKTEPVNEVDNTLAPESRIEISEEKEVKPTKETEAVVEKPEDIQAEAAKIIGLEETKEVVVNEPVYDQAYLDYKEWLSDPQVVAVIEARKSGKSVTDLMKEINAEDPSKLTTKDLYEKHLDSYGLTPEEKEIELDKFDGMSPLEKAQQIQPIKERLTGEFNKKLEQFINPIKQERESASQAIEKNVAEGHQKLESLLAQDEFMGLELTAERKQKLKTYIENNCFPDKNGKYDVDQTFKAGIVENFGADIVKVAKQKAETKAKVEVMAEITRPSKEITSTSAATLASQDDDDFSSVIRDLHDRSL